MKISAIIPARGGSKGIPQKNLLSFSGHPLLGWSILQAKASKKISDVYVSSDCEAILKVAREYGAIGIKRPGHLASDIASSESALVHALSEIKNLGGCYPELIVFLQATSPLRLPGDIDNAINVFFKGGFDSLFSVSILEDLCLWKEDSKKQLIPFSFDPKNRKTRQERAPYLLENGSIYLFYESVIQQYHNRFGKNTGIFKMPFWQSFQIDCEDELEICRILFEKRVKKHYTKSFSFKTLSAKNLQLIVYDFDGVMTDNKVYCLDSGQEMIVANRADGLAVSQFKGLGIKQIIVSSESNPVVNFRAKKLGIDVLANTKNKIEVLKAYCTKNSISLSQVAYIGNDLNDAAVMKAVAWPVAPSDAYKEVKSLAKFIMPSKGGQGVIRDFLSLVMEN